MIIDIGQLAFMHPMLRAIALWIEDETGLCFTSTSLYRIGDKGVHGQLPLRGIDLRMRNEKVGRVIVDLINEHFQYDYNRPDMKCAILHGEGANLHIHLQVYTTTRKVK